MIPLVPRPSRLYVQQFLLLLRLCHHLQLYGLHLVRESLDLALGLCELDEGNRRETGGQ